MTFVERLSVTPVKGTALVHPATVELTAAGAADDRVLHCIDARGRLVNAKQCPALTTVRSRMDGDELTLQMPDGSTATGPVALTTTRVTTSFYGRPVPGTVVDGPFGDAISDAVGRRLRLVRPEAGVAATDAAPVSLVAQSTLAAFCEAAGAPTAHWAERFRILVELGGVEAGAEERWPGRKIALGAAVLAVDAPIPRCAVTTVDPTTGVRDFATLAALRGWRADGRLTLGMWARVLRAGQVAVGDAAELVT